MPEERKDASPETQAAPEKKETKPAGLLQERWVQWVALTTTILAVCAAISSLKGGGYSTKIQILTTQEANGWQYYQSKSIKETLRQTESEILLAMSQAQTDPEVKKKIADSAERCRVEVARYKEEKEQIKKETEGYKDVQRGYMRRGGNFGLAVMLLQIAIMLSSVGALIRKPASWYLGMAFGAVGLVFMLNGYTLFLYQAFPGATFLP